MKKEVFFEKLKSWFKVSHPTISVETTGKEFSKFKDDLTNILKQNNGYVPIDLSLPSGVFTSVVDDGLYYPDGSTGIQVFGRFRDRNGEISIVQYLERINPDIQQKILDATEREVSFRSELSSLVRESGGVVKLDKGLDLGFTVMQVELNKNGQAVYRGWNNSTSNSVSPYFVFYEGLDAEKQEVLLQAVEAAKKGTKFL